jgi:hypothetical protein
VVAQYHDQGHIPTKLIAFDTTVNVSLGLPIRRTSVDHGTAHDIAWTGKASNVNMKAAIAYARKMADKIAENQTDKAHHEAHEEHEAARREEISHVPVAGRRAVVRLSASGGSAFFCQRMSNQYTKRISPICFLCESSCSSCLRCEFDSGFPAWVGREI